MMVYREATLEDAVSLSKRLRKQDEVEVSLCTHESLESVLVRSVRSPSSVESWAAEVDGEVIAIWGVHRNLLVVGIPWLMCSPEVTRYAKRLV